ncbi:alpha/beta hydrolase [Actinomadura barringtoniae]|uniref:Alpha/beta hydrolase n=1 Tax=Actinomadura barringtoniae TaxID=1427535 RepID=A0A939T657_9ACTN|nr:alpha/beta hydrolase [Actinomadura barringtoniae]MBO2451508.1 alpha/beta hydrolase [Actinomadura barringtoniae]
MGRAVRTSRNVLAATALGAGAAGAGFTAQRRAVRRLQLRPDPYAGEPFGSLRGRPVPVRAEDGTRLYAEIDGDDRTDLAIVFSHGWTLTQDSWHFQRKALRGLGRLVFWDQRGHGRSDGGDRLQNDISQLSGDLAAVIEQTVPEGTPVVLVGHSMGGMTIQRYADAYPETLGDRVVAAALLNTSSGSLAEVTLGLPAILARSTQRFLPRILRAAGAGSPLIEKVRHLSRDGSLLFLDQYVFGPEASPAEIAFTEEMLADTRMDALFDFFHSMLSYDVISECAELARIDTLVIGAENDKLTPVEHSLKIASVVPSARLEVVPTSGHMAMLERPSLVSDHLGDLIERTRTAVAAA